MESFILPPIAPVLVEATRSIGYSLETALADIVDNSIAAGATEIDINYFPVSTPFVAIVDNGCGMNRNDLLNAMRFGTQSPSEARDISDLGRFGLGLKTASLSQCRRLTVVSKKNGVVTGARWDLDFIAQTNDWALQLLEDEDCCLLQDETRLQEYESGTVVLWQEFDRLGNGRADFGKSMGDMMDRAREHLALVFHRFLKAGEGAPKVSLRMNGLPVEPADPFLVGQSDQPMDDEVINVEGQSVIVRPYVLPHPSRLNPRDLKKLGGMDGLRKQQGFYVYRNKRLLVWGTWFRMVPKGELSKLARVRVDIPNTLDYLWTLDIKKSAAVPPEAVKRNLAPLVEKLGERSKRTWVFRGKREIDPTTDHLWTRVVLRDDGVSYEISRNHPIVERVRQQLEPSSDLLDGLLKLLEQSLPVNQIYLDFSADNRVVNDEIREMPQNLLSIVRGMLETCRSPSEKEEMAARLLRTDPFNQYPELLDELFGEERTS